jgi:Zn-dependent peptidase ImmA (M78 family)/predicted secreted protein
MRSKRQEILRATTAAAQVLHQFPVGNRTSFDIVGAVTSLDIPLVFRPLRGLWGASITVENDARGVLVTTSLGLAVQRFTLAHELGHILLGHEMSLDETVGFAGRLGSDSRPVQELAADTFASELLAPRALMLEAARRHKWTKQALTEPTHIYQLSLRLGISFQAACWALAAHDVIPRAKAQSLHEYRVKDLKLALASESLIRNPWADVWKLTEEDTGLLIEAIPDDLFAIHLQDNASAGYLWELVDAGPHGQVIDEQRADVDLYGASTARVVFLRFASPGTHRLFFEHRRPWNQQELAHIDIAIDNYGKEEGGFARRRRERVLATA